MLLTLNKTKIFLNCIKPKIRIKRILGATEDGWVGAEKFPILVNLRLFPLLDFYPIATESIATTLILLQ
jgi:hypothetical protein